jgi:23S rRNA (adenine2503-C2)-methyltransferase
MPAERAMPIADTVELLRQYDFSHQRRCSFEYICFGGLNDQPLHGREIVKLLEGLECRVNLIRFHAGVDNPFPGTDEKQMQWLCDYLNDNGITTTIRRSRGEDILAACGMLAGNPGLAHSLQ